MAWDLDRRTFVGMGALAAAGLGMPAYAKNGKKLNVLMIVTDSRSRAGGAQRLGSGERSALITVSEELEWDYMCDDEHAGLAVPAAVFFGAEIEDTECPVGAWTFFLTKRTDGRQGMILALPSEVCG